jgi:hypothetical protein
MKRIFTILFVTALTGISACAQDNAARPSPPAKASGKAGNATISIDYSQPSVKGRASETAIWKSISTGANEATVLRLTAYWVEGKPLPKGKYGFFTVPGENEWTIILKTVVGSISLCTGR